MSDTKLSAGQRMSRARIALALDALATDIDQRLASGNAGQAIAEDAAAELRALARSYMSQPEAG